MVLQFNTTFKLKERPTYLRPFRADNYFFAPLTVAFKVAPALNAGCFDALIFSSAPVFGLRPTRAARLRTSNVPKPTSATLSPFLSAPEIISIKAAMVRSAAALLVSGYYCPTPRKGKIRKLVEHFHSVPEDFLGCRCLTCLSASRLA